MTKKDEISSIPAENEAVVQQIAKEIIEPALQKALADSREKGSPQEIISALANSYVGVLVDLMGRNAAASFLQGHAVHLMSLQENAPNS